MRNCFTVIPKKFQLTNAGEEIYNKFSSLFHGLDQQWLSLSNAQGVLTGDIHISCQNPLLIFLTKACFGFMTLHPKVNIHVHFASDAEAFISEQIDLAIVTMSATDSHLVQRKLFETELALAASKAI